MKAGDRVKISKGQSSGCNGWVPEMDDYVGMEATVVMLHDNEIEPEDNWVDLDIDKGRFGWNCNWLGVL